MTRLVNFGLGEVCDRLSILALKILHGEAKGADVTHFKNEQAVLLTKKRGRESGKWVEHDYELAAVNACLWYAEDELRRYRGAHLAEGETDSVINLAFRIQELNDRRAALVQQINESVGDKVQEKV